MNRNYHKCQLKVQPISLNHLGHDTGLTSEWTSEWNRTLELLVKSSEQMKVTSEVSMSGELEIEDLEVAIEGVELRW